MYKEEKGLKKKPKVLDTSGISVRDLQSLEPELRKKKYQVNIELKNGRVRYLYLNDSNIAELYVQIIDAKILKITPL